MIGETRARAIVQYRRRHGGRPFHTARDLTRIRGIGPGIVSRIREHLDLPEETTSRASP